MSISDYFLSDTDIDEAVARRFESKVFVGLPGLQEVFERHFLAWSITTTHNVCINDTLFSVWL